MGVEVKDGGEWEGNEMGLWSNEIWLVVYVTDTDRKKGTWRERCWNKRK